MAEEDTKNALVIQELHNRLQRLESQVASIPMFQQRHPRSSSPEARRSGDYHRRVRTRSPKANHGYDSNSSSSFSSFSKNDRYSSYYSSSSGTDSFGPRKRHEKRDPVIIPVSKPFSARIQGDRFPLPKGLIRPTDMKYDGSTDPQKHLDAFEARMEFHKVVDATWCRAFPVSLSGPAIRWFNSLPPGSIHCFADLSRKFLARYATIRLTKVNKHPIYLLGVKQKQGESIRDFLERFKRALLGVNTPSPDVVSFCFVAGLLDGDFRRRLLSKDFISMEEIQQIASEYM